MRNWVKRGWNSAKWSKNLGGLNITMLKKMNVLGGGYVALFGPVIDECVIAEVATVNTGIQVPDWQRLVKMLLRKGHMTPFEFIQLRWEVYAPVFVRDQIFRHRTFSFLAQSQRYSKEAVTYYTPVRCGAEAEGLILDHIDRSELDANNLLELGVSREIAARARSSFRYTRFAMRTDLRNLLHFLELRLAKDAQWETRQYAAAMRDLAAEHYPITFGEAVGSRW